MKRRTFLSSTAGTSLLFVTSGCLATLTLPDSEYEISTTEYWDETGKTGDNRPVSFSATVLGGEYDDDTAPVTVGITMENTSDETWYYRSHDAAGLFGPRVAEDERHQLLPPHEGEEVGQNFTGRCWNIDIHLVSRGDIPPTHELHSGGATEEVLELVMTPDETCPSNPPAAFEFSTAYAVYSDQKTESRITSGKWMFSIANE